METKVYETVEIIFLVCGHTKNICDRKFKELKRDFHHKNIYTMSQLINALNISSQVTALLCSSTDFFNWDTFFDKVYKRPAAGTVSKNHIFIGQLKSPGILITEAVCGIDRAEQNLSRLKKCYWTGERWKDKNRTKLYTSMGEETRVEGNKASRFA